MNKFIGHLKTVNKHRKMVRKLCFKCGLYKQGLLHDLSKYSPTEFIPGVKFYTGINSPHYGERQKYTYSKAWMHHKGRNKHHPEYWTDIGPDGEYYAVEMPPEYFAEMFCDRVAACMIYKGKDYKNSDPLEYYESHKCENQFNLKTRSKLEFYLRVTANFGVEEALNQIKMRLKYEKSIKK